MTLLTHFSILLKSTGTLGLCKYSMLYGLHGHPLFTMSVKVLEFSSTIIIICMRTVQCTITQIFNIILLFKFIITFNIFYLTILLIPRTRVFKMIKIYDLNFFKVKLAIKYITFIY